MTLPLQPDSTIASYDANAARYAARYADWTPDAPASDLVSLVCHGLPPRSRILDVGAGSGRDLARLRDAGHDAVGVDASARMLDHAVVHGAVLLADMRHIPLATGSVDAILAAASLLHLPTADVPAALAEFRRLLHPGGRLVLSLKEGEGAAYDPDGRFFQYHTGGQLDQLLAAAGFRVTASRREPDSSRPGLWWLIRQAAR